MKTLWVMIMSDYQQGNFRFFQDYNVNTFRPQMIWRYDFLKFFMNTLYLSLFRSKTLWKQMVHCWEFIPKALFIYLPDVWFLCSVEHPVCKKIFYLSTKDWSDLLCFKSTINYWNSVLAAATMKSICFSKYLISESNSCVSVLIPQLWNFVFERHLIFFFLSLMSWFDLIDIGVQPTC